MRRGASRPEGEAGPPQPGRAREPTDVDESRGGGGARRAGGQRSVSRPTNITRPTEVLQSLTLLPSRTLVADLVDDASVRPPLSVPLRPPATPRRPRARPPPAPRHPRSVPSVRPAPAEEPRWRRAGGHTGAGPEPARTFALDDGTRQG